MIRALDTQSSPEVQKQVAPDPADKVSAKDFASLHAAAVARDKKTASEVSGPARERVETPDGETWKAAKPGSHYAEITGGPRKGEYINLTYGERRGQTFTIEERDGKVLHVYGESGTEVEVKPSADARDVSDAARRTKHRPADQPREGERWAPVEGHSTYADILGGSRNGLYVNISGGVRDGMAFQIVKKGDKVFHVYGNGKHRQEILVSPKPDRTTADDTADSTAAADGGSAGAATG